MNPTQIKTFARLSSMATYAATTVELTLAAVAAFSEALRAADELPGDLELELGRLKNCLEVAGDVLRDVAPGVASIRQFIGLLPAKLADVAHYQPAPCPEPPTTEHTR